MYLSLKKSFLLAPLLTHDLNINAQKRDMVRQLLLQICSHGLTNHALLTSSLAVLLIKMGGEFPLAGYQGNNLEKLHLGS